MHLTRYHWVFAPHSKLHSAVTPAGRGKGKKPQAVDGADTPAILRHVAMSSAKRRKRVFGIDIEACARCGGKLAVIASIDEPATWSAQPRSSIRRSCRSGPERRRCNPVCCEFKAQRCIRCRMTAGWVGLCLACDRGRQGSVRSADGPEGILAAGFTGRVGVGDGGLGLTIWPDHEPTWARNAD